MERLFNDDTKVVYIEEKTDQYDVGNFKLLLWPFYAYKILVPMPKEHRFNLFQKYILKMCEAGITNSVDIDNKLQIGKELTRYILIQLKDNGMLDALCNLTETAKQLLNNEEELPTEQVAGYIFQSVYSGKIENIFMSESNLSYVDVEKIGLYSRFKYGTTGRPIAGKGLTLFPESHRTARPENVDILKAIVKYKKRIKIKSLSERTEFYETSIYNLVNEVSIVSETVPIWFVTKLFLPRDINKSTNWLVADPFGFGLNQTIREEITCLILSGRNDNLRKEIESLTDETFSTENINFIEILEQKYTEANDEILSVFGKNIKNNKDLFEKLIQFYNSYISFQAAANNSGKYFADAVKKVEEYLRAGYLLLEEIFYILNNKFKHYYPKNLLTDSSKSNNELIKKIFVNKIGFNDNENLNTYFLYQRHNLKSVLEYEGKEFRKLLAVTILTANEYPAHPLYSLAGRMAHFSNFLFEYKKLRDAASHSESKGYPFEKIRDIQEYLYSVLAILLEEYELNLPNGEVKQAEDVDSREIILRKKAELEVDKEFGAILINDLWEIRDVLIILKEKFIILQSSNVNSEKNLLNQVITDAIFNSSKLFELFFNYFHKNKADRSKSIPLEELDNLNRLISNRGFRTDKIHSAFYLINKDKIKDNLSSFTKGVLKEKVIILLMSETELFDKIAQNLPGFMEFLSILTEIRCHGDKIHDRINLSDTLDLVGEVLSIAKILAKEIKNMEK